MLSLDDAKDYLRIDGSDNNLIIQELINAIPDYIELTTGMSVANQNNEPLADTVSKFILQLWYYSEQADTDKLQRTIDGLLKVLTIKARA